MHKHELIALLFCVFLPLCCWAEELSSERQEANRILELSGIQGGMVVHLGAGEGVLTTALRKNDAYTVQGLEGDPGKVTSARQYITSQRLYGPVSVQQFDAAGLPYADDLVNLLVVEEAGKVSEAEMMRVLAPKGVLCVQQKGVWSVRVKPRPDALGEWTHYLQDAGHNPVAKDTVVGPPRQLKWTAPPLWISTHTVLLSRDERCSCLCG